MQFCIRCGTILRFKNRGPQKIFYCDCGFERFQDEEIVLNEQITEKPEISVMEDHNFGLAVHTHQCIKCGHNKAILIEIGAMYGDEADIIRFKCGKCGHVEQHYDSGK